MRTVGGRPQEPAFNRPAVQWQMNSHRECPFLNSVHLLIKDTQKQILIYGHSSTAYAVKKIHKIKQWALWLY